MNTVVSELHTRSFARSLATLEQARDNCGNRFSHPLFLQLLTSLEAKQETIGKDNRHSLNTIVRVAACHLYAGAGVNIVHSYGAHGILAALSAAVRYNKIHNIDMRDRCLNVAVLAIEDERCLKYLTVGFCRNVLRLFKEAGRNLSAVLEESYAKMRDDIGPELPARLSEFVAPPQTHMRRKQ